MKIFKKLAFTLTLIAVLTGNFALPAMVFAQDTSTKIDQSATRNDSSVTGANTDALSNDSSKSTGDIKNPQSTNNGSFLPLSTGSYDGLPSGSGSGQQQINDLIYSAIMNLRYIIGSVAITMIVYAGVRLVIAQGKEDEYGKQKLHILYAILGLAVVGLSGELVRILSVSCDVKLQGMYSCVSGGFLKDPNAIIRQTTLFSQRTGYLITFIKYVIGSVSVLFIVRSGLRMITMGSQEEKMALDKKNLMYGGLGLILIIMSDTVISKVLYQIDPSKYPSVGGVTPTADPGRAVSEIVGFTNLVLDIVTPLAILGLVVGGIMYVSAAGNEDAQGRAKRIITMTVIGILIMYGAFAIVSTIVGGKFI